MGSTRRPLARPLAIALLLVGGISAAHATVLVDRTLPQLLARAERVDVGVVTAQRFVDEGEMGVTETTVRIERTLRGASTPTLVLSQLGGERDGVVTELVGDARLREGDRVLLLTRRSPDGRSWLVGMALGAWRVDGELATVDLNVALIGDDGTLRPGPHARVTTLADVERTITAVTP
jgi:hypothetical protein